MLLTEKYRPQHLGDIQGHSKAIEEIVSWLESWTANSKPLLLVGDPGVGKTTIAYALAREYGYELFEVNASDERTKSMLQERVEGALVQQSLFGTQKLILLDEVDGAKASERNQLTKLLNKSQFPVLLTANDLYERGMAQLRQKCKVVKLKHVHTNSVKAHLKRICEKENITYDETALKSLASKANGDVRVALNDLQSIGDTIDMHTIKTVTPRDTEKNIFDALMIIFKTQEIAKAREATWNLAEDHDMLLEWIRENIIVEYEQTADRAAAYAYLSLADMYRGRIRQRQYWHLLKYVYDFLSGGIASAKQEKYRKFSKYRFPTIIKKRSQAKQKKETRQAIEQKLKATLYIPSSAVYSTLLWLQYCFNNDDEFRIYAAESLGLSEKEQQYIQQL